MKTCPLCEQNNIEYQEMRSYGVDCGKDFQYTHVWICKECPFIGLEYYIQENAETLFYEMREQERTKNKK